ncbi:hypothetical protein M0R04_01385 [Candidatus Dojkabacteria bacterium]|jgi:hypothetical protein|nr:hypothetical protein [Candidatus Dojkabacteria bacterium]
MEGQIQSEDKKESKVLSIVKSLFSKCHKFRLPIIMGGVVILLIFIILIFFTLSTKGVRDEENKKNIYPTIKESDAIKQENKIKEDKAKYADTLDLNNLPKIVQADFIDLDRISEISKFRSGVGHDFSYGTGETCRSMKHYFIIQETKESLAYKDSHNGNGIPFSLTDAIPIYSPVDGTIEKIESEMVPIGEQIYIRSSQYPSVVFRIFHIYKLDGISVNSNVTAGQQIGNIGKYQNTDIAVQLDSSLHDAVYISYFEIIPDSIFAKYQARGIKNREELITTKEYRDTQPFKCNGEQFAKNYESINRSDSIVQLSK